MDNLYTALTAVKTLRSSVGQVFSSLANGLRADHGEEGKENKFLIELQDLLTSVNNHLRCVFDIIIFLLLALVLFCLVNRSTYYTYYEIKGSVFLFNFK